MNEATLTGDRCLGRNFVSLRKDENYWQVAEASRGAFIIDGQDYYRAFREVLMQAEYYVCILAWDLMEEVELLRGEEPDDDLPTKLADFIYALVDRKPNLEVYIVLWDYSVVYLTERDWLPFTRFRKEPHDRIHLVEDSAVNIGASQHQKVVVADGQFALVGGLDLSAWRWDTQEHHPVDQRRKTPQGKSFQPYHDIQGAVTGEAAQVLDQLCRDRWQRAKGEDAPWREGVGEKSIWPKSVKVDFENASTAFALTYSEYKDYPAVTQIERLHLDMITAAEKYIYFENQYLSSHVITEALIQRLKEEDGPEIIIILTQDTGGWLEEGTLGLLRCRLLEKLTEADQHGHFGAYFPYVEDDAGHQSQVYVHAKVMICDDRSAMIGSANLSNRSMKVDSEVVMALGLDASANSAPELLRRLLSMHLGTEIDRIDASLRESKSINRTIRSVREGSRHQLKDLNMSCKGPLDRKLADTQLLDPDDPIDPGYWLKKTIGGAKRPEKNAPWKTYTGIGAAVLVVFLIGLGLKEAWGGVITKDSVETFFRGLSQSVWTIPILCGIFLLSGLAVISLNVLLVAATLAIGPWTALACAFTGSLLSAIAAFYIGAAAGKPILEKFFEKRMRQIQRQIQKRGVLSVAILRIVPIAPFVVINLAAGISRMKLSTFVVGTFLGMLPGMAGVVFVTHQAKSVYTDPSWQTWVLLGLGVLVFLGLSFGVKKYLKR
jgi:phosphatidylserine/phosphatidylglycerophosphate/cardiolipin synthase-like enzyme/uncharacterized membrane protein YdjX (TVP38/TMEM64 family)